MELLFIFAVSFIAAIYYGERKTQREKIEVWRTTYSDLKNMQGLGFEPFKSNCKEEVIGYVYGYAHNKLKQFGHNNTSRHQLALYFTEEFMHLPLLETVKQYVNTDNKKFFDAWKHGKLDAM